MDLSLSEPDQLMLDLLALKFPGVYPIHPFSTIITGLIQAGGIDTKGSFIVNTRDGESEKNSLYDYFLYHHSDDIQLKTNDIIYSS